MENVEEKLTEQYKRSPHLSKRDYLKVFFTCGFYCGISDVLKLNGVLKSGSGGVKLETLRSCFRKINDNFGLILNDIILGNEVDKIKKGIESETGWDLLINHLYSKENRRTKPQKRNFFAHAGFEGNVTQCKRQKDELYVKYASKHNAVIKKWLEESV